MSFSFSQKGEAMLAQLHPDMLRVVRRMMSYQAHDWIVISTLRTPAEQKEKLAQGVSATLRSKHLPDAAGLAGAIDLAPYPIDWNDKKAFGLLMGLMIAAAAEECVEIRCGGNWDGDNDLHDNRPEDPGHFELKHFQPA